MEQPTDAAGTAALRQCLDVVRGCSGGGGDLERLEQLRVLEEVVCAAQAAQARLTTTFVASRRAVADADRDADRAAGIGPRVADRRRRQAEAAITAEVGLARRVSPHRAARQIGLAHALSEMPRTRAAFDHGDLTEWQVTILARETACLTLTDRHTVDAEIGSRPGGAGSLAPRQLEAAAKKIAYRLDPHATTRRAAKATADRHVSLRPAPDTMTLLTALLPVKDGVACHAALTAKADAARAAGDDRSRGQLMADLLVDHLTGTPADAPTTVDISLVMSEATLLDADDQPAHLPGHGPIPAPMARDWITDPATQVFLRRLYTRPGDGALVAMDSRRRLFPQALQRFVALRDDICRTPWCGAPIRHTDHATDAADSGPTSVINAQGLCERCNHAKQAARWKTRAVTEGMATTTPSGWTYTSPTPPPVITALTSPVDLDLPPPLPPDDLDWWNPPPPPDGMPEPPDWLDARDDVVLALTA